MRRAGLSASAKLLVTFTYSSNGMSVHGYKIRPWQIFPVYIACMWSKFYYPVPVPYGLSTQKISSESVHILNILFIDRQTRRQ